MDSTLKDIYKKLVLEGNEMRNKKWQSIDIDTDKNPMVGINNLFIEIPKMDDLVKQIEPDMPWSENHFLERINGKPINPGNEYKNWPYYSPSSIDNDEQFRAEGKFSHNYMERYWGSSLKGMRYEYGDLNDVIERIKENPYTRQAFLGVWWPEDQSNNNVRVPCTIGYWFHHENGKLNITYLIRSMDAVRHMRNDIYMSYRLLEHVSKKAGLQSGNLKMWVGNLHCFKSDLYTVGKLSR